jgi:hypothetical protein
MHQEMQYLATLVFTCNKRFVFGMDVIISRLFCENDGDDTEFCVNLILSVFFYTSISMCSLEVAKLYYHVFSISNLEFVILTS